MSRGQRAIKSSSGRFRARQARGYQGDDSRSSARNCCCRGVREQRAAWSFCLHLRTPWGSAGVREMWRHRAQAGSSAFVGPMPTNPVEFRKCARDLKALSASKERTNEERGGGRDPGVRRPGAGRGQLPARSKIFRAAMHVLFDLFPGYTTLSVRVRANI